MLRNTIVAAVLGLAASAQGCVYSCCGQVIDGPTPAITSIVDSLGFASPIYPIGLDCVPAEDLW